MTDIFTCLDLEMNQNSNTIIQIGYVIGNIKTKEIIKKRNITVFTNEILRPDIMELTGITQKDVSESEWDLFAAYCELKADHEAFKSFINPCTWGGGDSQLLYEQLRPLCDMEGWPFGRRWIDVKTIFITHQLAKGKPFYGGLKKSMSRLGMEFKGEAHQAMTDAENTFITFCELVGRYG